MKGSFYLLFFFYFTFHPLEFFVPYYILLTIPLQVLQGGGVSNEKPFFPPLSSSVDVFYREQAPFVVLVFSLQNQHQYQISFLGRDYPLV